MSNKAESADPESQPSSSLTRQERLVGGNPQLDVTEGAAGCLSRYCR
jgi:hypothetical protein